jgi:hypothetical protein
MDGFPNLGVALLLLGIYFGLNYLKQRRFHRKFLDRKTLETTSGAETDQNVREDRFSNPSSQL